ncbi:MAG TPA: riboflavin synthase [Bryobacteraceae bacterium]|nr:riboflavin synthase [Bryobacteraceae bacterium]
MFTGIVEEVGSVARIERKSPGARLTVACSSVLEDATIGASIAVNGACLTAIELTASEFSADLSPETLKRTNLGDLEMGSAVNLERPLRFNGRLDGHFVLGHVDGTAKLISLDPLGEDNWWLRLEVPAALTRYIVSKASVAVDGISLTVAGIEGDAAAFTIIPQTVRHTALHSRKPGARLNLEVDILAKHLEKLVQAISVPL